jgi:hypothetical protein
MTLNTENLEKFKDHTLLYIVYSKDRTKIKTQIAQILFKRNFTFYKKYVLPFSRPFNLIERKFGFFLKTPPKPKMCTISTRKWGKRRKSHLILIPIN